MFGTILIDYTSSEEDTEKNTTVYNRLLLSMDDNLSFGLINDVTNSMCPDSYAALAWNTLQQKYKKQTNASLAKLMNQFKNLKLQKPLPDLDVWILELELL